MKVFGALAGIFLVIVVILSLLTALTSAPASLVNGLANAAASAALLTSQCLSVVMVVVVGVGVGITGYRFVSGHKTQLEPPPHSMPDPYPFVRVQPLKPADYLPTGQPRELGLMPSQARQLAETWKIKGWWVQDPNHKITRGVRGGKSRPGCWGMTVNILFAGFHLTFTNRQPGAQTRNRVLAIIL